MSHEIIRSILAWGKNAALVTVVEVSGSGPRHVGAKMLVKPDAATFGTVGGGKVEAEAIKAARDCLARRSSGRVLVEMRGADALGDSMICGGTVWLSVEWISDFSGYRAAANLLDRGQVAVLASDPGSRDRDDPGEGLIAVLDAEGHPVHTLVEAPDIGLNFDADAVRRSLEKREAVLSASDGLFYDAVFPAERLLVLGGGHIGRAAARAAVELGFRVSVGDERPDFADPARFPPGVEVLRGSYTEIVDRYPFDSSTYVVIVSPGHDTDLECVRAILRREYRYAGFIGSRRKARMIMDQAKTEGFDAAKVDRLHAPIGLDIGAETPEEIALSIMAEIVATRRNAASLASLNDDKKRKQDQ